MIQHFQFDTISEKGLELNNQEEMDLMGALDECVEAQIQAEPEINFKDLARNIGGLAFMAGRSYQEEAQYNPEDVPQYVDLRINPHTAGRLLEFLLQGDEQ
jgi:hypothetical protein